MCMERQRMFSYDNSYSSAVLVTAHLFIYVANIQLKSLVSNNFPSASTNRSKSTVGNLMSDLCYYSRQNFARHELVYSY